MTRTGMDAVEGVLWMTYVNRLKRPLRVGLINWHDVHLDQLQMSIRSARIDMIGYPLLALSVIAYMAALYRLALLSHRWQLHWAVAIADLVLLVAVIHMLRNTAEAWTRFQEARRSYWASKLTGQTH